MPDPKQDLKDEDPIQFNFATYGELKRVFGPARAAAMIRTREKKLAQGAGGPSLTRDDIEVALTFLRGEKTGAQSSRALKAFRSYFGSNERARKACETYLANHLRRLPAPNSQ